MNVYVVAQAARTCGLPQLTTGINGGSYRGSRLKGEDFQKGCSWRFGGGIRVYVCIHVSSLFQRSRLPSAISRLPQVATAKSHNLRATATARYTEAAVRLMGCSRDLSQISRVNPFDVKPMDFEEGLEKGRLFWTPEGCGPSLRLSSAFPFGI